MSSDLLQGERFRVLHGEALLHLQSLSSESVDAVITDPPYSSGGMFRGDRMADAADKYVNNDVEARHPTFGGDNRDQRSYSYWTALWLSECLRIAKPGSPICLFTDWRQLPTTTDALQAGGWLWRGIVVWDKTEAARPDKGRFRNQCEYIVWGSKGPMSGRESFPCFPGVYRYVVRQADKFHIAGKPSLLMRQLARICEPGGTILDPFLGSGSTGVGALLEGYRVIGIEQDDRYAEIARERLQRALEGGRQLRIDLYDDEDELQEVA